jgi:hypothetical protein
MESQDSPSKDAADRKLRIRIVSSLRDNDRESGDMPCRITPH